MPSVKSVVESIKGEKPRTLDEKIKAGLAKLEGYEQLDVLRRMSRSGDRMERHYEAFAKQIGGLNPEPEDGAGMSEGEMRDQIVLGDQIILGDKAIQSLPTDDGGGGGNGGGDDGDDDEEPAKEPVIHVNVAPADPPTITVENKVEPTPIQVAAPHVSVAAADPPKVDVAAPSVAVNAPTVEVPREKTLLEKSYPWLLAGGVAAGAYLLGRGNDETPHTVDTDRIGIIEKDVP